MTRYCIVYTQKGFEDQPSKGRLRFDSFDVAMYKAKEQANKWARGLSYDPKQDVTQITDGYLVYISDEFASATFVVTEC